MSDAGEVSKQARTIVLCFDGTSNEYDADNTNVVKFFALLKKDDFNQQVCYYQPGIGTWFNPGVVAPVFRWGAKILDEAFAWYLDAHVIDGYRFLMQNYRIGDKICIFGFSRGAYTARALAGFLYKIGVLPRENEQLISFAYKLYKREDQDGITLAAGFKRTFCQDVKIEFLGVWDTVASVGVVMGRTLPFTNSNTAIKTFRHALSLDEHRAKFRPNNYHRPAPDQAGAALDPEHGSPVLSKKISVISSKSSHNGRRILKVRRPGLNGFFKKRTKIYLDSPPEEDEGVPTDVMEVWFSGCHSDVGGGAVLDATEHSLANVSLRWMVHEVMLSQCGILFDQAALTRASITNTALVGAVFEANSNTESPRPEGLPASEHALDAVDALQSMHDQLKANVLWWLLEIVPLKYSWQDAQGVWHQEWSFHLGRGRKIQDPCPKFHFTVKTRMDSSLQYKPRARWTPGTETYVS